MAVIRQDPSMLRPAARRWRAARRRAAARGGALVADVRGAVAIEFAITLPLLLLLNFMILQYGFVLVTYHNMYDAARQAARQLAAGTADEAEAVAAAEALLVDWPTSWTVVAQSAATTGTDDVRVRITVPGSEAGIFGFTPMPTELAAEVVMREE
jgi:Flp pilus assembly protein TadG